MSFLDRFRSLFSSTPAPSRRARAPLFAEPGSAGFYTAIGYRSARVAEQDGRSPTGGSSKIHELIDRERLIKQSRDFERDNELYAALLRRVARYVVGRGFTLQCLTGDPEWNRTTEARFREWWRKPEVTGVLSGRRVARLVMKELLVAGDIPIALTRPARARVPGAPSPDRLQLFEAEQLKGPNAKDDGIERDGEGTPTAFFICPYTGAGTPDISQARRYPTNTIVYVADPDRPSTSRPVPPNQAGFPLLHRIKDISDSEAISWQVQARLAVAVTRAGGAGFPGIDGEEDDDATDDGIISRYMTQFPQATVFHGSPGDKVEGIARTAPSSTFAETLRAFLRMLAAIFGCPLELLLFDFAGSNYSQMRGTVEVFQGACEDWQEILEELLYIPTFAWWLQGEVAAGEIEARDDMRLHAWIKDRFPWIDRLKETQASGEQLERGMTTHAEICAAENLDRTHVLATLEVETVEAIEASQRIKERTGVEVPWERFAGLKAPAETVTAQDLTATQPDDSEPPAPEPKKGAEKALAGAAT